MEKLFQKFRDDANHLVTEEIKRFKYWEEKIKARGMKPTPGDIEREYRTGLENLMKRMRQVTQKTLTGNENQELASRVRAEGQRHLKRFVDECLPNPTGHVDE